MSKIQELPDWQDGVMVMIKASDLEAVRRRRFTLADILNSNLLSPESRAEFQRQYQVTGEILEDAAKEQAK